MVARWAGGSTRFSGLRDVRAQVFASFCFTQALNGFTRLSCLRDPWGVGFTRFSGLRDVWATKFHEVFVVAIRGGSRFHEVFVVASWVGSGIHEVFVLMRKHAAPIHEGLTREHTLFIGGGGGWSNRPKDKGNEG